MNIAELTLQGGADFVLNWLGQALIFGTLLSLMTAVVARALRGRLRPSFHVALWTVVLLKFVVPAGPDWSLSLSSAGAQVWNSLSPEVPTDAEWLWGMGGTELPSVLRSTTANVRVKAQAARPERTLNWPVALAACYVAGVWLAVVLRVVRYRRFAQRCAHYPVADGDVLEAVERAGRIIGVSRRPVVRVSDEAPSPYIFGGLRPTLVVAQRQLREPRELQAVVLHELAHLRRGDLLIRYVQWIAGTLLFFWPVVAWINRRIDLAREHACDEWALRHGNLSAAEYARCLLRAVQPVGPRRHSFQPAAMALRPKSVERRIEMILNSRTSRTSRGRWNVFVVALIAAWVGFALTGVAEVAPPEDGELDTAASAYHELLIERIKEAHERSANIEREKVLVELLREHQVQDLLGSEEATEAIRFAHENLAHQVAHVRSVEAALEERLDAFLADHPSADADGDGHVTPHEHAAFFVTMMMWDPAFVLENYPEADRDSDGVLSVLEAARLIRPPHPVRLRLLEKIKTEVELEPGQVEEVVALGQVEGQHSPRIVTQIVATDTGETDVADWLLEQFVEEPTADEVARTLQLMHEAHQVEFFALHPEADVNGDGLVDTLERIRFMESHKEAVHEYIDNLQHVRVLGLGRVEADGPERVEFKVEARAADAEGQLDLRLIHSAMLHELQLVPVQDERGELTIKAGLAFAAIKDEAVAVRRFPLRFTDVQEVVGAIQELLEAGVSAERPGEVPLTQDGSALAGKVSVQADVRSNALIVSGSPDQVQLVAELVSQLDVQSEGSEAKEE